MGILIDSSVFINVGRSGMDLSTRIRGREEEATFLSVVSASELLDGVHRARTPEQRGKRLAFVGGVLAALPTIEIDVATARSHAQLWAELSLHGMRIGVNDSWIAATCLTHGLRLATGNVREFERIPGLEVEKWI